MAAAQVRGVLNLYQSYKMLFKIKWQVYNLGDYTLPRPIPLDGLMIFIVLLLPLYVLAMPIATVFHQPQTGVTIVLDLFLTWVVLKWDPQGRPFPVFFSQFVFFFLRPKKRDFTGKAIPKHRQIILYWDAYDIE